VAHVVRRRLGMCRTIGPFPVGHGRGARARQETRLVAASQLSRYPFEDLLNVHTRDRPRHDQPLDLARALEDRVARIRGSKAVPTCPLTWTSFRRRPVRFSLVQPKLGMKIGMRVRRFRHLFVRCVTPQGSWGARDTEPVRPSRQPVTTTTAPATNTSSITGSFARRGAA